MELRERYNFKQNQYSIEGIIKSLKIPGSKKQYDHKRKV